MFVTTITVANQNQLPQPLENSLIDSEVGSLVNQNQLLQSLKDSLRDTVEESFGTTLYLKHRQKWNLYS